MQNTSSGLNIASFAQDQAGEIYPFFYPASGRGEMDLRFATALPAMNICDTAPLLGDLGIPAARLVAPGSASRSILLQRLKRQDVLRMPPIGGSLADGSGILLLETWIQNLSDCQ